MFASNKFLATRISVQLCISDLKSGSIKNTNDPGEALQALFQKIAEATH